MKITFLICLTAIIITWSICYTVLLFDYQRTAQLLDHINTVRPTFRITPDPEHL